MLEIRFDGFDRGEFKKAVLGEVVVAAREEIAERLRAITCPEHKESPTVTWGPLTGDADEDLKGQVTACCEACGAVAAEAISGSNDDAGPDDPILPEDFTGDWKHSD